MRRIGDRTAATTTVMHALVIVACIVLGSSTGCSGVPSSGSEERRGSASDSRAEQQNARSPSPEETRNTAPSAPDNARNRGAQRGEAATPQAKKAAGSATKPKPEPKPAPRPKPRPARAPATYGNAPAGGVTVAVSRVVDGDTVEISPAIDGVEEVRLIGVDTPETVDRHTFTTLWLESGGNPKVLQEILGNSRIDVTLNVYSHVLPHIRHDAMDRFGRRFFGRS